MRTLLALALMLALTACGFHLRGVGQEGALSFTKVRVEGDGIAVKNLRDYLASYKGIELVTQGKAETVIRIVSEQYSKDVFSVNNSGRVAEYRLNYQLKFAADHLGENVLEEANISLNRNLSWNDNSILSKESEEATLIRDMQRDVVQLVLRRISAAVKRSKE